MQPTDPLAGPDAGPGARDAGAANDARSVWPYIGVGCLTVPIGFFGGGMIAVLIAKIVGAVQNCPAPKGLPACMTFEFLVPGALIGGLGLPLVALWRLRRGRKATEASGGQSR